MKRQGIEVIDYNLDHRILASGGWFGYLYKRRKKAGFDVRRPGPGDILFHACQDMLGRALVHEVDWVIVVSGMYMHPDWMTIMQRAGIKLGVILTESPYDDQRQGPFIQRCDVAWTNERSSVDFLRMYNPNVFYLPHAHDPARHFPFRPGIEVGPTPAHDVVFVGTGFQERIEVLSAVNWDGIDFGLYGEWSLLGSRSKLRQQIKGGPVENQYATLLYKRAKICLNLHRMSIGFGSKALRITDAESLNPRAIELAACGVFTISDYRPEIEEVFGGLVPTFSTPTELEDAIRYYLAHDEERARIAAALPHAVGGMTFDERVDQIMADLERISRPLMSLV